MEDSTKSELYMELAYLKVRYSTLSEIESEFPRSSKHKTFSSIVIKMKQTLSEIEIIKSKLLNYGTR